MKCIATTVICFVIAGLAQCADPIGRIVSMIPQSAKAEVIKQGQRMPAELGAEIFAGDRLVVPAGARVAVLSGRRVSSTITLEKNSEQVLSTAGSVVTTSTGSIVVRQGVVSALRKGAALQRGDRVRSGQSAVRMAVVSEARLYDLTGTVTFSESWLAKSAFLPNATHLDNPSLIARWLGGAIRKPRGSGRNYAGDKLVDTFRIDLRDDGGIRVSWKNRLQGEGRLVVSAESGESRTSIYEGSFSITAEQIDLPAEKLAPRSATMLLLNFIRQGRPVPEDSIDTLYFRVPTREDIDMIEEWIGRAKSQPDSKIRSSDLFAIASFLSNSLFWPTRALEVALEAAKLSPNPYAKDLGESLRGMLRVRAEGYR